jgi:c-di-GMP-binding flagellar brake protein YcgR
MNAHLRAPRARRERGDHGPEPAVVSPPIWLPQPSEPVTVILATGEKLPARALERTRSTLLVAVVVRVRRLREHELRSLVIEYANPGGRVRLSGKVSQTSGERGVLLRVDSPQLLDVVQQRQHIRVAAECPIALQIPGQDDAVLSHTIDISASGVLVARTAELPILPQLEFTLAITPGTAPVTGTAEVVRIDDLGRAGLHFGQISPADRWRLIRFTVDCQSVEAFRHPALDDEDGLEAATWRRRR